MREIVREEMAKLSTPPLTTPLGIPSYSEIAKKEVNKNIDKKFLNNKSSLILSLTDAVKSPSETLKFGVKR